MLKFEVYHEESVPDHKPTVLRLVITDDGDVLLKVVNAESGTTVSRGNLLAITPKGRIKRCAYVNPDLGFQLDSAKKIKLVEEA